MAAASRKLSLRLVQEPLQCRISSNNFKEKRAIDPAPIVKLTVEGEGDLDGVVNGSSARHPNFSFLVVHATLWSEDLQTEMTVSGYTPAEGGFADSSVNETARRMATAHQPILMGSLHQSGYWLKDLQGQMGFFFIFSDLRVRIEGRFRLQFALFDLTLLEPAAGLSFDGVSDPELEDDRSTPTQSSESSSSSSPDLSSAGSPTNKPMMMAEGRDSSPDGSAASGASNISAHERTASALLHSQVFTVYSARHFPGMTNSTPLTRCFALQGIRLMNRTLPVEQSSSWSAHQQEQEEAS
ncbi:hypothetical protein RI367_003966 [Sorochytrium milnesiophthora]